MLAGTAGPTEEHTTSSTSMVIGDTETQSADNANATSMESDFSPSNTEGISMSTMNEECKEQSTGATSHTTENIGNSQPVEAAAAIPSVQRSESSTAMDVNFTPATSPPKPLSSPKVGTQQIESGCSQQANNSSVSQ